MSAACPATCCDVGLPFTALFSSGHLYPDVTITGAFQYNLIGSSTLTANFFNSINSLVPGVLSIPNRLAVGELTSSL